MVLLPRFPKVPGPCFWVVGSQLIPFLHPWVADKDITVLALCVSWHALLDPSKSHLGFAACPEDPRLLQIVILTTILTTLPRQPTNHGRPLFYYFVEAKSASPLSRPLTLWLNGGLGCSSLGYESNMLYVESPIGVGFSCSNTRLDYLRWNDTQTAKYNLIFLINWLEEFPNYKDFDLFLTSESYAGHYIPQLAGLLIEYNKNPNIKPIKLRAIALGNPLLDLDISVKYHPFRCDHIINHGGQLTSSTSWPFPTRADITNSVCNDLEHLHEDIHGILSQGCKDVFNRASNEFSSDVAHDDLLPNCLSSSLVEQFRPKGKHEKIHAMLASRGTRGDPCLDGRVFTYLNKPQVQKTMHANITHLPSHWNFCIRPLEYQEDNLDMNLIPLISDLIEAGIPIVLYSGDQDSKIPLTQTRIIAITFYKIWLIKNGQKRSPSSRMGNPWALEKKEKHKGSFTQPYVKGALRESREKERTGPRYLRTVRVKGDHWEVQERTMGGWSFGGLKEGKNVTFLTYALVRGAAHEVPFTSPSQALHYFVPF
ncbi:hypothetical protein ACJW30_01G284900 [Castanea mollissima]